MEEIAENPYFQYFIWLPGYKVEKPFVPFLMIEFRKRLNEDVLTEINEMVIEYNKPDDQDSSGDDSDGDSSGGGNNSGEDSSNNADSGTENPENNGALILDAICAPSYIAYPQDVNLLNEAQGDLEKMID